MGVPLLIFANKQDLTSAASPDTITEGMGLKAITDRTWQIQRCIATNGEGVKEGMQWMSQNVKK